MNPHQAILLKRYRWSLAFFMLGLVISGLTAFPLLTELELLVQWRGVQNDPGLNGLDRWLVTVRDGLQESYSKYPWIAYGTDWLAFAHLVIALFFIGPFLDPIRNVWALYAGVIACIGVIPLALICGEIRGLPMGWRWIDSSFGVIGLLPLLYCIRITRQLQSLSQAPASTHQVVRV